MKQQDSKEIQFNAGLVAVPLTASCELLSIAQGVYKH